MEPAKAHLLPHSAFPEQRSCSYCGKRRSLRARRTPEDQRLRKASVSANVLVVEVYHYYHASRPDDEARSHIHVAELQVDSALDGRAELSGSDSLSRTAFRGQAELSPVTEEPPYVDVRAPNRQRRL
ncbi:hypothetical protein PMIN01_12107 [Paraphaeosphaeria minitans]|uniref:Uncharacterized protein n=1 Tax=Paraphaeosphaeria minitans TaxID=565426 RepID=A0A9P6G9J3_9PLEO|nr:hypothetical protein PMIN01_12107 [Paraphaeosphaeria minitans]